MEASLGSTVNLRIARATYGDPVLKKKNTNIFKLVVFHFRNWEAVPGYSYKKLKDGFYS